jgi:hypothetical protein
MTSGLPVFGYGPLMGLAHISGLLGAAAVNAGVVPAIKPSSTWTAQSLHEDLILLGWPRGNEATAAVMERIDVPVHFTAHDGREISARVAGEDRVIGRAEYEGTGEARLTRRDVGVGLCVANPTSPGRSILILAGSETFGVVAAAEAISVDRVPELLNFGRVLRQLWHIPIARLLLAGFVRRREWCFVVRCEVDQLTTTPPQFLITWSRKIGTRDWRDAPRSVGK